MDTSMEEIPNLPDYDKTNTTMDTEAPSDDDDSGTNTTNNNNPSEAVALTMLPPLPEVKRGYGGKNATGCTDEECFFFASAFVNFFNVLKRKQIMEVPVEEEEEEDGGADEGSIYTDDESRNMSVISLDVTATDGEEEEDGIVNVGGDIEEIGEVVTSGSMKSVVSRSSSSSSAETSEAKVAEEVAPVVVAPVVPTETKEATPEATPASIESVSREIITTSQSNESKDSSTTTTKSKKERNFQWGKKSIKKLRQSHQNRKNRKRNASMSVSFSEDATDAGGMVGATPDAADVESDVPVNDTAVAGGVVEKKKKKRKSWKKRLSMLRKSSKSKSIAE